MLCLIICLLTGSAVDAGPLFAGQQHYSTAPVVHAAPAFVGPAFAPVPSEQQPATVPSNEIDTDEANYSFEYAVQAEDGSHSRQEARDAEGTVRGRYTIMLNDGRFRVVDYIADKDGFRAKVETNEPGTANQAPADVQWTSSAFENPFPAPHEANKPSVTQPSNIAVVPSHAVAENPSQAHVASLPPVSSIQGEQGPVQLPQISPEISPVGATTSEEPRSPHHPPTGFLPPQAPLQVHFAPHRPIGSSRAFPSTLFAAPSFQTPRFDIQGPSF